MYMKKLTSWWLHVAASVLLFAAVSAQAEDKKADPTGTWTWTQQGRDGGQGREVTLKLKAEGEKLTGSMPGRQGGNETQIANGKIKGDEISFEVTREFQGNSFTSKYTGKVSGDTITGKISTERDGQSRERDWTAKRKTEEKKVPKEAK